MICIFCVRTSWSLSITHYNHQHWMGVKLMNVQIKVILQTGCVRKILFLQVAKDFISTSSYTFWAEKQKLVYRMYDLNGQLNSRVNVLADEAQSASVGLPRWERIKQGPRFCLIPILSPQLIVALHGCLLIVCTICQQILFNHKKAMHCLEKKSWWLAMALYIVSDYKMYSTQ